MLSVASDSVVKTRTVNGKTRQDIYLWVSCPLCGEARLLRRDDAQRAASRHCRACTGKKGYQATLERYGKEYALERAAQKRAAHPSSLEKLVQEFLDAQKVTYLREAKLSHNGRCYFVDFVLPNRSTAIEVNGRYVHSHHTERDRRKIEALRAAFSTVLVFDEQEIHSCSFQQRILTVLN